MESISELLSNGSMVPAWIPILACVLIFIAGLLKLFGKSPFQDPPESLIIMGFSLPLSGTVLAVIMLFAGTAGLLYLYKGQSIEATTENCDTQQNEIDVSHEFCAKCFSIQNTKIVFLDGGFDNQAIAMMRAMNSVVANPSTVDRKKVAKAFGDNLIYNTGYAKTMRLALARAAIPIKDADWYCDKINNKQLSSDMNAEDQKKFGFIKNLVVLFYS